MKKYLIITAIVLAAAIFLFAAVITVMQLCMSGNEGWPAFTLRTFFNGKYFSRMSDYFSGDGENTDTGDTSDTEDIVTDTTDTTDTEPPEITSDDTTDTTDTTDIATDITVTLTPSELFLEVGDIHTVDIEITPSDAPRDKITLVTDNDTVAEPYFADGIIAVSARAEGVAEISVFYDSALAATLSISVSASTAVDVPPSPPPVQLDDIDPDLPMIALTFDDGPSAHTSRLLDTLKLYNCHATFCIVGNRIESYPETLGRIADEGHEFAVHTWNHKRLTNLTTEEIKDEILTTRDKLYALTGVAPRLIRPPYGSVNDTVKQVSVDSDMIIVNWSIDPRDWQTRNADSTYNAIMETAFDGGIILCHDLHKETVDAMERVIPALREMGYQLVTVSQLLAFSDAECVPGMVYRKQ